MAYDYDILVIGGGPAGYVAAIRAAQLGFRTACIDMWEDPQGRPALGGTCLNAGCIPSKALLESSELYEKAKAELAEHGIGVGELSLDLAAMHARKDAVVSRLTQGIAGLFKANGVTSLPGRGTLLRPQSVEYRPRGSDDSQEITAEHIIIATGSRPVELAAAPVDGRIIVDSAGALALPEVPRRLGVIGAGVIGLELGSVWRRLGAEVILLEAQDVFLAMADHQIATAGLKEFRRQGLDIRLGTRVTATEVDENGLTLRYQDGTGDHEERFDRLIVAVGRRPNSEVAARESGLLLDERGMIHVDEHCRTNLPGVWAIGDVVRGPMLAHKGSEEGIMVVERIAGQETVVDYDRIPSVIYTLPEVAWVGRTEEAVKAAGEPYRVGVFPFAASGRALAKGESVGMVKLIAHAETDRLLGAHMLGAQASELIAQAVIVMSYGGTAEDLALTVFAHPTLSEAVHEAALAVDGRAIHVARPRRG